MSAGPGVERSATCHKLRGARFVAHAVVVFSVAERLSDCGETRPPFWMNSTSQMRRTPPSTLGESRSACSGKARHGVARHGVLVCLVLTRLIVGRWVLSVV